MGLKDEVELDVVLAGRIAIIRLMLEDRRISGRAIAKHIGIHHSVVSAVLNGKHPNPYNWLDVIDDAIYSLSIERGITHE